MKDINTNLIITILIMLKERSQLMRMKLFMIIQTISSCKSTDHGMTEIIIRLKECPAYEKTSDIELEECPAYVEKKKDQAIKLEDCPAYVMAKE